MIRFEYRYQTRLKPNEIRAWVNSVKDIKQEVGNSNKYKSINEFEKFTIIEHKYMNGNIPKPIAIGKYSASLEGTVVRLRITPSFSTFLLLVIITIGFPGVIIFTNFIDLGGDEHLKTANTVVTVVLFVLLMIFFNYMVLFFPIRQVRNVIEKGLKLKRL